MSARDLVAGYRTIVDVEEPAEAADPTLSVISMASPSLTVTNSLA
ncbi:MULTISPECIES: hypothetical protein [unclassified Streptomyces]|nr:MULTISPECIES: hypothetical protein [unclassified Streptomyces]